MNTGIPRRHQRLINKRPLVQSVLHSSNPTQQVHQPPHPSRRGMVSVPNQVRPPINDDPNENGEVDFYNKILPGLKTVVIAGAAYDDIYINKAPSTVEFHLFEPNAERCEGLRQKFGNRPNTYINQCGLSDSNKESEYYADTQSCVRRTHDIQSQSTPISIPMTTLDKYCMDHELKTLDFLKIDVEGLELPILLGGADIVPRTKFIQFEYGGTWKDSGYKLQEVYSLFPDKMISELFPRGIIVPRLAPIEDFRYTNYIMTNKN